jgi:hypothetical protein
MFTFEERAGGRHYLDMDLEVARWYNAENKNNAQYGVQPILQQLRSHYGWTGTTRFRIGEFAVHRAAYLGS